LPNAFAAPKPFASLTRKIAGIRDADDAFEVEKGDPSDATAFALNVDVRVTNDDRVSI
jgi:hypothetical protein